MVVEQLWQPVPGGSGTYIVELVRALRAAGLRPAGLSASHPRGPSPQDLGLGTMAVRSSCLPRTALYESWNHLHRPLAEAVLPGAEVVHATTWAVPATRLPLVVTVHDTAFLRSPEHFTRRGSIYFQRSLARVRNEAHAVITPSQATAEDCAAAGIDADCIRVIPHGVRIRRVSPEEVATFRTVRGLEDPYVLWTGTHEPRKNLPGLLRAFTLVANDRPDLDLVLVGPAGWGDSTEVNRLASMMPERIHVLGRLSDEDLAAAYAGAHVFAFPSLWEGFGLPVLEAMAYGVPVVTSRGTSMEEVCGDAGLLADPASPEELSVQILLAAGEAHDDLVAAGRRRSAAFTWEACATAHAEVYASLARGELR